LSNFFSSFFTLLSSFLYSALALCSFFSCFSSYFSYSSTCFSSGSLALTDSPPFTTYRTLISPLFFLDLKYDLSADSPLDSSCFSSPPLSSFSSLDLSLVADESCLALTGESDSTLSLCYYLSSSNDGVSN